MSQALNAAQLAQLSTQNALPTLARILVALAVVVTKWDRHRRTRKTLLMLEPHALRDIGLTQGQAQSEAIKPFWQD